MLASVRLELTLHMSMRMTDYLNENEPQTDNVFPGFLPWLDAQT